MNKTRLLLLVDRKTHLLRQSIQHYLEYGFDQILLCIINNPEIDNAYIDDVKTVAEEFSAIVTDHHPQECASSEVIRRRIAGEFCKENDWLFLAYVDELHQYSSALGDMVRMCIDNGVEYITGNLLDRLGSRGNFPDVDLSSSVWDQFPVAAGLSQNILTGQAAKVVAFRCGTDEFGEYTSRKLCAAVVHQFKWDSTAIKRFRHTIQRDLDKGGAAYEFSEHVLRYLDRKNEVSLEDLRLNVFWPKFKRSVMSANSLNSDQGDHFFDPVFFRPVRKRTISLGPIDGAEGAYILSDLTQKIKIRISQRGAHVWQLCDGTLSVAEICDRLSPGLDVESKIERGLQKFIIGLIQHDLLNS